MIYRNHIDSDHRCTYAHCSVCSTSAGWKANRSCSTLIFDNEQRIRWGSTSSYWRPCSSLPVPLLAPMLLPVFLLLLVLLMLAFFLLHYECCSMMSLLLLFFPAPMPEKFSGPWNKTFYIPPCLKILVPRARPGLPPGARLLWHGGM